MIPDKLPDFDGAIIPHLCKEDNNSSYLMVVRIHLPEALRRVAGKNKCPGLPW